MINVGGEKNEKVDNYEPKAEKKELFGMIKRPAPYIDMGLGELESEVQDLCRTNGKEIDGFYNGVIYRLISKELNKVLKIDIETLINGKEIELTRGKIIAKRNMLDFFEYIRQKRNKKTKQEEKSNGK